MTGLVEFLLARIAEAEEVARKVAVWLDSHAHGWGDGEVWGWAEWSYPGASLAQAHSSPLPDYIARHDPARVLAKCAADRRIVEAFLDAERAVAGYDHDHPTDAYWQEWGNRHALALAVELLALPHADHPDYREEWRP